MLRIGVYLFVFCPEGVYANNSIFYEFVHGYSKGSSIFFFRIFMNAQTERRGLISNVPFLEHHKNMAEVIIFIFLFCENW